MDGDGHWLEIATAPGAKAVVTGQSATRIHPCPRNFSTQQWKIRVAPHSELVVLPGPAIPFQGARSYQRVEIDLRTTTARLIWAEIWHPGRYDRGDILRAVSISLAHPGDARRRAGPARLPRPLSLAGSRGTPTPSIGTWATISPAAACS